MNAVMTSKHSYLHVFQTGERLLLHIVTTPIITRFEFNLSPPPATYQEMDALHCEFSFWAMFWISYGMEMESEPWAQKFHEACFLKWQEWENELDDSPL